MKKTSMLAGMAVLGVVASSTLLTGCGLMTDVGPEQTPEPVPSLSPTQSPYKDSAVNASVSDAKDTTGEINVDLLKSSIKKILIEELKVVGLGDEVKGAQVAQEFTEQIFKQNPDLAEKLQAVDLGKGDVRFRVNLSCSTGDCFIRYPFLQGSKGSGWPLLNPNDVPKVNLNELPDKLQSKTPADQFIENFALAAARERST